VTLPQVGGAIFSPARSVVTLRVNYTAMAPATQRSKVSIVFTSTVRVLFTALLFTAGGMGVGLFCGIVGTVVYGMIIGSKMDMTNAYRHVAIPVAITLGAAALVGAVALEVRSQGTSSSLHSAGGLNRTR
jgi:hypothetical protein